MIPKLITKALKAMLQAPKYTPLFLSSAPGLGKSSMSAQVTRELGWKFLDIRVSQFDAVDFRGLPVPEDGKTKWLTPDLFPTEGNWVVLLDELPDAPTLVQSALYQLVLDGRLGDYIVPPGVKFMAAGNRQSDRAAAGRLSTALANRFIHIEVDPDLDSWCQWAIANDIRTEVIAFLRFRPELLHQFDPAKHTDRAFPTPRSWEFVSRILDANPPEEVELDLYAGAVGKGAGAEFAAFIQVFRKLPSPDAVLIDPDGAEVPDESSVLYALCGALARKASEQNADRLFRYAARLPQEYQALLVSDATKRCKDLKNTRAYIGWAAKNSDWLL